MHSPFRSLVVLSLVLVVISTLAVGCSQSGPPRPPEKPFPPETVTLLITGVDTAEGRRSLNKELGQITDTPGNFRTKMNWATGQPLTVLLTPVSDPEAFAKRVDFGTVDKIEGKTIHITYQPSSADGHE